MINQKVKVIRDIELCHESLVDEFLGDEAGGFITNDDDMVIIPKDTTGILKQNKLTGYYYLIDVTVYEEDDEDGFELDGTYKLPLEDDEIKNYFSEVN